MICVHGSNGNGTPHYVDRLPADDPEAQAWRARISAATHGAELRSQRDRIDRLERIIIRMEGIMRGVRMVQAGDDAGRALIAYASQNVELIIDQIRAERAAVSVREA